MPASAAPRLPGPAAGAGLGQRGLVTGALRRKSEGWGPLGTDHDVADRIVDHCRTVQSQCVGFRILLARTHSIWRSSAFRGFYDLLEESG